MGGLYLIAVLLFILPLAAHAEVVFSDDFEWGSDWNSSQGTTAPIANGWSGILCTNRGGSYEAAYVNSAGAKQGSRGFIQYWDQTEEQGSAQDIWLTTAGIEFPDEYYVGYWFKVDPGWGWAGNVNSLKIIKTEYVGGTTWNINWCHVFIQYCADGWCNVDGTNWTGDASCEASISTDANKYVFGCWSDVADGNWHYFVWHMKHSTGVLECSIDGVDAIQMSPAAAPGSPYTAGVSTTRWNFGGNITDGGGTKAEQWTAYDDLIIATTEDEVLDFLGMGDEPESPGTTIRAGGIRSGGIR